MSTDKPAAPGVTFTRPAKAECPPLALLIPDVEGPPVNIHLPQTALSVCAIHGAYEHFHIDPKTSVVTRFV